MYFKSGVDSCLVGEVEAIDHVYSPGANHLERSRAQGHLDREFGRRARPRIQHPTRYPQV